MRKTILTRILALGVVGAALSHSAYAVVLAPGTNSTALGGDLSTTLTSLTGGTLLASNTGVFSNSYWTGTVRSAVIRETTGTLSFLYQVSLTSGGTSGDHHVTRLTVIDYSGFTTDVGYITDAYTGFGFSAFNGGSPDPHYADRLTGDVIGFDFKNAATNDPGLFVGDITKILYVRTDATNYTRGVANVINGSIEAVPSFAPAAAVPGPLAAVPFTVGLASAFIRRRKNQSK